MEEPLVPAPKSACDRGGVLRTSPPGGRVRESLRRAVFSLPWSAVVIAAAVFDLLLCLKALSPRMKEAAWFLSSDAECTLIILGVYVVDVAVKIVVLTLPVYLRKCGNILDFTITILSLLFTLMEASVSTANGLVAMRSPRILRLFMRLVKMGHCCRGAKWAQSGWKESVSGVRHIVGMNKRRFVDVYRDFDLDLAYIQPCLIAMSVPAQGCLRSLYRNPIMEVVRFFETFHPNAYMIANCCPELPYPAEYFETGRVVKFDIQDHTPPTVGQVVEFLNIAREWMECCSEHVLAVHCKGGKGRTGSLCAAWMIYTRSAQTGVQACDSFAAARTDSFLWYHKQTVDTPSQVRYLEHISKMLSRQDAYFPLQVASPRCERLRPLRLTLMNWFRVPVSGALVVAIHERKEASFGKVRHWSPAFRHDDSGSAAVELELPPGATLEGDLRVSVFRREPLDAARARSRDGRAFPGDDEEPPGGAAAAAPRPPGQRQRLVAGKEPGCLFYFMFHTSFIDGDGKLNIPLSDMDKAGKGKDKSKYNPDGVAVLEYVCCPAGHQ